MRYTIDSVQLTKQHTQCTLIWTAACRQGQGSPEGARKVGGWEGGSKGRMGGREGGREEAMMLGRERASVEEGMVEGGWVDEGNERGREGTRHGQRELKRGGRKRAEEGLNEDGREQGRNGSKEGKETSRALASVQYHKPSHNAALGLETLVLQMKNSEQV